MKPHKSTKMLSILKKLSIALLAVCPPFLLCPIKAEGVIAFTNQDDLLFKIVMPKTNWTIGETITASMVVSNMSSLARTIPWQYGDPCTTGFGNYLIVDAKTGSRFDCIVPLEDRANIGPNSLGIFNINELRSFDCNLTRVYGITNAGSYWVQATGRFQYVRSPGKYFTLVTPPINITIAPKAEVNAPPK
jgi:hypothetical protein